MGIDIYMKWEGQTEAEKKQQLMGFSVEHGHVGYLREAYHGEPYATQFLLKEAFEAEDCQAQIPAAVLRERLEETLKLAIQREENLYEGKFITNTHPTVRSYVDFVALAEEKERETGKPVTIYASY